MKKFMNDVSQVENEMIQGMVKAYPTYLKKLDCGNVVVRTKEKTGKVTLISGGGSGHEPAHKKKVFQSQDILMTIKRNSRDASPH